jgi:hypothetical protein
MALSMLAGGTVTELAGGDAVTAGWAAQNTTVNNYLTHSQDLVRRARLADADSDEARTAIESEYATLDAAQKELAQKCLVGGQCPTVIDRMGYQSALDELVAACEPPRLCTDEMRRSKDQLFSLHSITENAIAPLYVVEDFLLFGSALPVVGSALRQVTKLLSRAASPLLGAFSPGRAAITNAVPSELARVIPGRGNFPTLGPPSRGDVFVTAADDIAGLNSLELARKLTIPESNIFTVVRFQTPRSGLASPVNRTDLGFVGGGRTTGGAREFVIPNSKIPADARIEVIVP